MSIFALVVGRIVIPKREKSPTAVGLSVWKQVDLTGALLLILGLSVQLVGLSLGGNELPWTNIWVISSLVGSFVLLGAFLLVEAKTTAIPVIPLRMLHGILPVSTQIANVCVGMSAYAVCSFMLPPTAFVVPNKRIVPVQSSPILPSRPPGQCFQGWRSPCHSLLRNPRRRPRLWYHHVAIRETKPPGARWCRTDVCGESSRHGNPVLRC